MLFGDFSFCVVGVSFDTEGDEAGVFFIQAGEVMKLFGPGSGTDQEEAGSHGIECAGVAYFYLLEIVFMSDEAADFVDDIEGSPSLGLVDEE